VAVEDQKLALEALRRNLGSSWSELKVDPPSKTPSRRAGERSLAADTVRLIGDASLTISQPPSCSLIPTRMPRNRSVSRRLTLPPAWSRRSRRASRRIAYFPSLIAGHFHASIVRCHPARHKGGLAIARDETSRGRRLTETDRPACATTDGAVFLLRLIDTKKTRQAAGRSPSPRCRTSDVNVRLLFQKYIPKPTVRKRWSKLQVGRHPRAQRRRNRGEEVFP